MESSNGLHLVCAQSTGAEGGGNEKTTVPERGVQPKKTEFRRKDARTGRTAHAWIHGHSGD